MTAAVEKRTRVEWAERLRAQVEAAAAAILNLGCDLLAAREDMPYGEWCAMVRDDLGRTPRWAQQLMSIARHGITGDAKQVSQLPADTDTLYKLSRVPADRVRAWIDTGEVAPTTTRSETHKLIRQSKHGPGWAHTEPNPEHVVGEINGLPIVERPLTVGQRAELNARDVKWAKDAALRCVFDADRTMSDLFELLAYCSLGDKNLGLLLDDDADEHFELVNDLEAWVSTLRTAIRRPLALDNGAHPVNVPSPADQLAELVARAQELRDT